MQHIEIKTVRLYWLAFGVVTLIALVRIVTASSAYFETADEPLHVGCGMWWFDDLYPEICIDHTPLPRAVAALPLYVRGLRAADSPTAVGYVASAVLRGPGGYEHNLALARLGILPFFVIASLVVWLWTRRLYGYPAAIAAVCLFGGLPPILAHSGLVTTDMALAAFLPLSFFALVLWLETPSLARSALLGMSVGLSVASKHSALPYFAAASVFIVAAWGVDEFRRQGWSWAPIGRRVSRCALALLVAFLVVWAAYRFSMTPLSRESYRPHAAMSRLLHVDGLLARNASLREGFNRMLEMPVPAADLARGIMNVAYRDGLKGRWSYFMGEVGENGWRLFFPALIAFKSPIPFLLLAAIGVVLSVRRGSRWPLWQRLAPLLGVAGIMAVAIPAPINIGVRHVLPVYPSLAIVAGLGLVGLFQAVRWRVASRGLAVLLVAWFVFSSAAAHPDYLPYFNELAGDEPQHVAIHSDLDWNQDIKRLFARLHEVGANRVWIHCDGCGFLTYPGLPPLPGTPAEVLLVRPYEPVEGWVAMSEWSMRVRVAWERIVAGRTDGPFDWLDPYPYSRIGKSFRLYYVPPKGAAGSGSGFIPATMGGPRRAEPSRPRTAPSSGAVPRG